VIRASGALTSAQGRDYYEREYARGDYYTGDGPGVGVWSGRGAKALHLEGEVDKAVFEALLEGKAPGDRQLIPCEVGTGKHRAGWDFTCSPDKSVSVMALVGGDRGIAEDVAAANRKAMVELERFALAKNRDRSLETTGNLVIASFRHDTSRRLDPQLHIHNVVMNLTRRADRKWTALETREMFAAQVFVKRVFHADLARRLVARGYGIEILRNGEVAIREVPRGLCDTFSKRRRKDIEPYLEARGQSGAKAAERAAINTRRSKDRSVDAETLRAGWRAETREWGADLQAIRDRAASSPARPEPLPREAAQEALAFATRHLAERKAAFPGRELLAAALGQGMGRIILEDLKAVLPGARNLVRVDLPASPGGRYTTREALGVEVRNIEAFRQGVGAGQPIASGASLPLPDSLSEAQRRVAQHILTSPDQVLAVEGKAGAGKTHTLQAVVEAAKAQGWQVRGLAPDTSSVQTLAEEAGVPARTLAALAVERSGLPTARQLWLVDEAGKMSSRQAEALFLKAREAEARVVLVGDRLQHAAVEAGMPFAYLQEAGLKAVRLDEIRRQQDPELRAAVASASEGRTREAVQRLAGLGQVEEHPDRSGRHQAVAEAFLATPRGQSCLVIAPSHDERKDLNQRIREALIAQGRVARASHPATILVSRGLTLAQKQNALSYEEGDRVRFHQGSQKLDVRRGQTGVVLAVDRQKGRLQVEMEDGRRIEVQPRRNHGVEVFREEPRRFAVGDRIQYREAQVPEGSRVKVDGYRIANGQVGVIRAIDGKGRAQIQLEGSGRRVALDLGRPQPIDHAYALTSHSSQGRTVDRALVVVDTEQSRELVNRQQFYVGISRARLEARVFTDSREELPRAVDRDAGKASALALVKGQRRGREVRDGLEAGRARGPRRVELGGVSGGVEGGPGRGHEPAPAVEERHHPAGGPAGRGGRDPLPATGLDGGGRFGMGAVGGAERGLPGDHPPMPGGPGGGEVAAGGGPPGPAAGLPGREDRGFGTDGAGPGEPGLRDPGDPGRGAGDRADRRPVPGAGPGGLPPVGGQPGQRLGTDAGNARAPEASPVDRGASLPPPDPGRGPAGGAVNVEGLEADMRPIRVPPALKELEPGIQRLSARIRACGQEDPFREEALRGVPKAALRGVIREAETRGLMDPGWGARMDQMKEMGERIRRMLDRQMGIERQLPGGV